jgi:DNA-directed RNA polymerase specialized sigma24 family protein
MSSQETYVPPFAKLDEFGGPDGFSAWLARIAYNEGLGTC